MPDPSIWTTQEVAGSAMRCATMAVSAKMEVICKEAIQRCLHGTFEL